MVQELIYTHIEIEKKIDSISNSIVTTFIEKNKYQWLVINKFWSNSTVIIIIEKNKYQLKLKN